jgi:ankyrin repeat protein
MYHTLLPLTLSRQVARPHYLCVLDDPMLPLVHRAVFQNDKELLELLLQNNPSAINERYDDSDTPLHFAIRYGHDDLALFLIEHGANLALKTQEILYSSEQRPIKNYTALSLAAFYGRECVVRALLDNDSDIFNQSSSVEDNLNPLIAALSSENTDDDMILRIMKMILQANSELMRQSLYGHQPSILHMAALRHYYDATTYTVIPAHNEIFIDLCQSYDAFDHTSTVVNHQTPLMIAVRYNTSAVVRALIDAGASYEMSDDMGHHVLHYACNSYTFENAQQEEQAYAIFDVLFPVMTQILLNQQDNFGNTPLHLAVKNNHTHIVHALLQRGVNVALLDSEGCTAFHHAKNLDILRAFLNHQPELINIRTGQSSRYAAGSTLLHLIVHQHIATARWNGYGRSLPRHQHDYDQKVQLIQELVARGADLTIKNEAGYTPEEFARAHDLTNLAAILTPQPNSLQNNAAEKKRRLT